jgi:hypothetical protein
MNDKVAHTLFNPRLMQSAEVTSYIRRAAYPAPPNNDGASEHLRFHDLNCTFAPRRRSLCEKCNLILTIRQIPLLKTCSSRGLLRITEWQAYRPQPRLLTHLNILRASIKPLHMADHDEETRLNCRVLCADEGSMFFSSVSL